MAISLSDIHNAVRDYFSSLVVPSITVTPLPEGTSQINPGEHFSITLTAKNSVDDPAQGVQISNVCYHVQVDHPKKAQLIVPSRLVAVARKSADKEADTVPPKDERQELFLFPPDDILEAGATGSLPIQGHALVVGAPKLSLHVHGNVKIDTLFPPNQKSSNANQKVEIEQS